MSAATPPPRVSADGAERRSGIDRRMNWTPPPTATTSVQDTFTRVQAGPVLTGFIVALATWILLEFALIATGVEALQAPITGTPDAAAWWWSGAMACVALFLGGLTAGATARQRAMDDGVLHAIAAWCLTIVAVVVLAGIGIGVGFGVLGDFLATISEGSTLVDIATPAAAVVLLLGSTFLAGVVGAMVGSWLWAGREGFDETDYSYRPTF